ncbi:MAG TPA: caspase family protein, partial [Kofleriaceae bacterium]|nr:caspase family protein [Kofleriaceae bacterium]
MPRSARPRGVQDAFDRSVAIVMGVNTYQRGLPQLRTAVSDAEAIGALLAEQQGFTQVLLRDGEVTRDRVRSLLSTKLHAELGREIGERDRLLLYFAGHGLSLPSEYGPEGHLLLADAQPDDSSTFLAMAELRKLISATRCRHVLVVLDCCFAGTFRWAGRRADRDVGTPVYRETLERFVQHRAWQVLVSASHDQTAQDDVAVRSTAPLGPAAVRALQTRRIETERHSPFATALLQGLRGAADYTKDGLIVAAELELFVRDAVERATQVQQTPQLYKLDEHDRGEFVFQVPGSVLQLEPAPALSLAACLYQGLQPYSAAERDRFFGRGRAVAALVEHVKAKRLTAVIGPSGMGKSSLLAAGLVPALRELPGWTVVEVRPDARSDETLRDAIQLPSPTGLDPGRSLLEQITMWLSAHVTDHLCLAIDQAEDLELLAIHDARDRVLDSLAQALEAHGDRLRVVLTLRSEFDPVFRSSALGPFWNEAVFHVPPLSHHELREIIERPARALELSFEPPSLVDALIDEVLQAPGGLALLSFALRELYARCAARNTDRLLTEDDYLRMGRLSGALAQRASALLEKLVAQDPACAATARRVFLRMVVERDGEWSRRRAHRDEFVYTDKVETQRAATLLATFRDARLVMFDKHAWEPAHDWLVRGWPMFSMWRTQFSTKALTLQAELANAAQRWHGQRRTADLWSDDTRLPDAVAALVVSDSWLNACERTFIAASLGRRRFRVLAAVAAVAVAVIAGLVVWDLSFRTHVAYYRDYDRTWGEPKGVDELSAGELHARTASFRLVRKGHLGHVVHVDLVRSDGEFAQSKPAGVGYDPELELRQKARGERTPCQWDFAFESDTEMVSTETARDRSGAVVYVLRYDGPRDRRKAQFLNEKSDLAPVVRGEATRVQFWRSPEGYDIAKHYIKASGEPGRNQDGIFVEKLDYDARGNLIARRFFDAADRPMPDNTGIGGYHAAYDPHGNQTEITLIDETGQPVRGKEGHAGWRSEFDEHGNEIRRTYVDETGKPTPLNDGYVSYHATYDAAGNRTELVFLDDAGKPTRDETGVASFKSTFDAHGNEITRTFFDETGKPTWSRDGYAGYRLEVDPAGNLTVVGFLDDAGKPIRGKEGHAGWHSEFDNQGNETRRMFVDETGAPTRDKFGVASYKSTFDARGNETGRAYFDEAGKPIRNNEGYASYTATFDPQGNRTEVAYLDETGKPTRSKHGYASYKAKFDARGNLIEASYFDETGKPTRNKQGYAGLRAKFDPRGNQTETTEVDETGKSVRDEENTAGSRSTYDARGHATQVMFLDETGKPARVKDGFAGYRSAFDARGNEIEHVFLDEAGNKTRLADGQAGHRSRFGPHGYQIEQTYIDEASAKIRGDGGYATYRSTVDVRGNVTEVAYFDEADRPVQDRYGVAIYRSTYDPYGNETERNYFDVSNHPIRNKDGYAGYQSAYDPQG